MLPFSAPGRRGVVGTWYATILATGFAPRRTMISSPASARATRREKCVFASWMETASMRPMLADLVRLVHSPRGDQAHARDVEPVRREVRVHAVARACADLRLPELREQLRQRAGEGGGARPPLVERAGPQRHLDLLDREVGERRQRVPQLAGVAERERPADAGRRHRGADVLAHD